MEVNRNEREKEQITQDDRQLALPVAMPIDLGKASPGVDPMANVNPGDQKYEQWKHDQKMAPLIEPREREEGSASRSQPSLGREGLAERLRREDKQTPQRKKVEAMREPEQGLDHSRSR